MPERHQLVDQSYWDGVSPLIEMRIAPPRDPLRVWLERHVPRADGDRDALEVGCCPGRYLAVLGELGYRLNGIDLRPDTQTTLPGSLAAQGYRLGTFLQADFFTAPLARWFDLVCSFGFIEHFENWEQVLQRHFELVKPGGLLVVETPNFLGLVQRALHSTLDRQNYRRHCVRAMSPRRWARLAGAEGFEVLASGFFPGFDFWVEDQRRSRLHQKLVDGVLRLRPFLERLPPSALYSPYAGLVARRLPAPTPGSRLRWRLASHRGTAIARRIAAPSRLGLRAHVRAPAVSVVIPCFNYGRFVEAAVASVTSQTLQDCEVIVVDDGSTDPDTTRVLRKLRAPRTRVFRQRNRGLPAARNAGILRAAGRYVCCLDADDVIDPTYLEKALIVLESRPAIGMAYSQVQRFGLADGVWHTESFDLARLIRVNHVAVSAVFRRDAWRSVHGYDETMLPGYEDWEYWIRLGARGFPGALVAEPLLWVRKHGPSMSDVAQARHKQLCDMIRARHLELYEDARRIEEIVAGYRSAAEPGPVVRFPARHQMRPKPPGSTRALLVASAAPTQAALAAVVSALRAAVPGRDPELLVVLARATTCPKPNLHSGPCSYVESVAAYLPHVYVLEHLLPEHLWREFLPRFVSSHDVDVVVCVGSEEAFGLVAGLGGGPSGPRVWAAPERETTEDGLASAALQGLDAP